MARLGMKTLATFSDKTHWDARHPSRDRQMQPINRMERKRINGAVAHEKELAARRLRVKP